MGAVTIIITIFILVISTIGFYILIWPQIAKAVIKNSPTMQKDITNDCAQQCSNMPSSKRPQCLTWCKSKFGI